MSARVGLRWSGSNKCRDRRSRSGKARRLRGSLVVGLVALSLGLSACSSGSQDDKASVSVSASKSRPPSPSATPSASSSTSPSATPSKRPTVKATVSNYRGWNLRKAVADARKHHVKSVSYRDASELRRAVAHTYNWKICSQDPSAGADSAGVKLAFKIVEIGESCTHPPRASSGTSSGGGKSSSSGSGSSGNSSAGGSSTKTHLCSIRSNAGNCYQAGQFCRNSDVGATTTDAAGREITCGFKSGRNRWHY